MSKVHKILTVKTLEPFDCVMPGCPLLLLGESRKFKRCLFIYLNVLRYRAALNVLE